MTGLTVRLGSDEMWTLLDHVDLVSELRDGLRGTGTRPGELRALASGLLAFHPESDGPGGELPAGDLRELCAAGLAALAAQLLHGPAVITASVVGPRHAAQWQLGVLGRFVPDVSHFAVFTADRTKEGAVDPRVRDQLDLSGIGLSVTTSVTEAVLGANLVVALGQAVVQIGYDQLASGSVVVNVDGRVVPAELRDQVTRRYGVDDLSRMVDRADAGHIHFDEVLLVDLLEPGWLHELETRLAGRLVAAGLELGVGILDRDGASS